MPSGKRGLPDTFDLEVADDDEPAELGNFLERSLVPKPKPARQRPPLEAVPDGGGEEPAPSSSSATTVAPTAPVEEPPASKPPVAEQPAPSEPKPRRKSTVRRGKRPPRKEIGLDPQTIEMIEALVRDAREQSSEPDIRASEIVRPLVQAAYEARRHVKYGGVGRRGQWGSQTARALITDLKDAFAQAITDARASRSE